MKVVSPYSTRFQENQGWQAFRGRGRRIELGAGAGVELVAPGIAEQIKRKHGDHDGERGNDDHVRRVEEETACGKYGLYIESVT